MDPFAVPLGLQIAEEVPVQHIEVDLCDWERDAKTPTHSDMANRTISKAPVPVKHSFDVSTELTRIRLARSAMGSILEPFSCIIETLKKVQASSGEEAQELLSQMPSLLDFYPDELMASHNRPSRRIELDSFNRAEEDLSLDAVYKQKKSENVEAVGTVTAPEPATTAVEAAPAAQTSIPSMDSGLIKTTAEGGISVAHSPSAYDLSGSMPWANYTTDGYKPLSPMDVRFHRVHLCSPNIDKPRAVWKVMAPKLLSGPITIPPDGSCPFKTSSQLSLRDSGGEIILMESVEQFPLLMHFHGMSGTIIRYQTGSKSPHQLGHLIKPETEFIPRVFWGNAIKHENMCCTIFESSLLRAPALYHQVSKTDFLLVRSRASPNGVLQQIKHMFVVGQAEPLYRVDVPVGPRMHQSLSARVLHECRRFWLKAKQLPNAEFVQRMFIGERRSLVNRYLADAVRDIQQRPGLPLTAPVSPEEACVINAMKEGVRRLAERGIERIFAISPMRIRNYVRDIEVFERSMPATSRTPRIAHLCAQLENEMRLSTWNLTNDYWDVMTGKRGAMFQFSPLGDPSGGRGEGLSYRKNLKTESASTAVALSSIAGVQTATMEIEEIRSKSKKELVAELEKLNVPERVWKTMSRWQLMRQLALLLGVEDDSEERLAPWKRKALHAEKIADAWKKQIKALTDVNAPDCSHEELVKAAQTYRQYGVSENIASGTVTPIETPMESENEKSDDGGENLLKTLLQDIQAEPQDGAVIKAKPKITRLEIVSTGRTKSTGNAWTQVTYVYGKENIALYRKWKELEEEGRPAPQQQCVDMGGAIAPPQWQEKVEMTLKVHRRFQRIIKQAAEAGRPIPDCKRCGACHLFGHDQTFEGCPVLIMDMGVNVPAAAAPPKKKRNIEQSPVYD
jgi:hypothetical protein